MAYCYSAGPPNTFFFFFLFFSPPESLWLLWLAVGSDLGGVVERERGGEEGALVSLEGLDLPAESASDSFDMSQVRDPVYPRRLPGRTPTRPSLGDGDGTKACKAGGHGNTASARQSEPHGCLLGRIPRSRA